MTTPVGNESVEYDILLNAKQALKELQTFNRAAIEAKGSVDSLRQRIVNFEKVVAAEANKAGIAFERQLAAFQKLDSKLRSQKKFGVFGNTSGTDPFAATQEYHNRLAAVPKGLSAEYRAAGDSLQEYNRKLLQQGQVAADVTKKTDTLGKTSTKASKSAVAGINLVRTAMHVLVTSAIFAVIGAFAKLFSMAITGLREMETGIYNLVNAERKLSEGGIDITPQGLDETIRKLQELDPLLSKIQATELVSRISANVAPSLGFNAKEIEDLSQAIAVLAVRNKGLGKSFEEVESQVTNAFLSGRVSVGINQLGVKITDQIVRDEALRMGLVKTADEFDNLTGKMEANIKSRAMLSVLTKNTQQDLEHLPEFFKTADARFGIFQARLQDFLTIVGRDFGPLLAKTFEVMANALEVMIFLLEKSQPVIERIVSTVAGLIQGFKNQGFGFDSKQFAEQFAQGYQDAQDSLRDFGDYADTATADVAEDVTQNLEEADDAFEKFKEKLDEIILDFKRKQEDLDIKQQRKFEDLDVEYDEKNADAYTDYQRKIADINQDTQEKIADIKQKKKEEDKKAERKYLRDLEKLHDEYLMNLEDALRERDARKVIKLQKQYELDKKYLEQAKEDEAKQRQESTKQDIEDAKKDRERKIKDAQLEYQRKLADLALAKKREYDEIVKWRMREEDDLRRATNRRLTDLVREYLQNEFFTQEHLNNLRYMIQQFSNEVGLMRDEFYGNIPPSSYGQVGSIDMSGDTHTRSSASGLAEGGTLIATRPTKINVAENRPELITATPLGKPGMDLDKVFSSIGSSEQDRMRLKIYLSHGLEAEIVDMASNKVATTIERIRRER